MRHRTISRTSNDWAAAAGFTSARRLRCHWPRFAAISVFGLPRDYGCPMLEGLAGGVAVSVIFGVLVGWVADRRDRAKADRRARKRIRTGRRQGRFAGGNHVPISCPQGRATRGGNSRSENRGGQTSPQRPRRRGGGDGRGNPASPRPGALFFAILAVLYVVFAVWDDPAVTPAIAICVLLGIVVAVYGYVLFRAHVRHAGVMIALAILAVWLSSFGRYPHRFAGLDYEHPVDLGDVDQKVQPLIADRPAQVAWLTRQPKPTSGPGPKMIVIATSGGGLRAAVWTTTVLAELETAIEGFPGQVRLITGASGGMLGAAYYVATLTDPGPNQTAKHQEPLKLIKPIAGDSLTPAARELVLRNLPLALFFRPLVQDRGWALEQAWEDYSGGALTRRVRDLYDGEEEGWLPSLVFTPLIVETGRRLLISNLNVGFLTESKGRSINPQWDHVPPRLYSQQAEQFFTVFPNARDLRLSTAVRMNASFPYISPDARLPTVQERRIVDAGYYDNYGVDVAARWIYQNHRWLTDNLSGVVLIQIRDEASEQDRTSFVQQDETPPGLVQRGLSWALTLFDAIASSRESSMSYRNDAEVAHLAELLNTSEHPEFFTTVAFELTEPASLSWYLAPHEIRGISQNVREDPENPDPELKRNQNWCRVGQLQQWLERGK